MSGEIGELFEEPGKVRGHWRIPNFLSLPQGVDEAYQSPPFFFFDTCWRLNVYPNGETKKDSIGWIGLYLQKMNYGSLKTVDFSFGVKSWNDEINLQNFSCTFSPETQGSGRSKFLKKSELQCRNRELLPSDALTIIYTVENRTKSLFESYLFRRLWNMSITMEYILSAKRRTDVTLRLKDGMISAHKIVLESRSAVFNRMFGVDMLESETGEVIIEDTTVDVFRVALSYVYSGDPKGLTVKNVGEVYRVAHKYEMFELRELCTRLMQETLSLESVCDVIALAELYEEMALKERAEDYFTKNRVEIIKSEQWDAFKKGNPIIAFEILESIINGSV